MSRPELEEIATLKYEVEGLRKRVELLEFMLGEALSDLDADIDPMELAHRERNSKREDAA